METVLIDAFIVPEDSKPIFLEQTYKIQGFIKTLPGFVEGFVYEQQTGESPYNLLTIAVWENNEAFDAARRAVSIELQLRGFNPQETMKALRIERVRSTFTRSPY